MNFIEFKEQLAKHLIFDLKDIKAYYPKFDRRRLSEWQNKNYIQKIINGRYIFTDLELQDHDLYIIANKLIEPSYISFESALSFYNLIPESIYAVTSATAINSRHYQTSTGQFIYKKIKAQNIFGVKVVKHRNQSFLIAEIEKAVLDFLYNNSQLKSQKDIAGLRVDPEVFFENIDNNKFQLYLEHFSSTALERRAKNLLRYLQNA